MERPPHWEWAGQAWALASSCRSKLLDAMQESGPLLGLHNTTQALSTQRPWKQLDPHRNKISESVPSQSKIPAQHPKPAQQSVFFASGLTTRKCRNCWARTLRTSTTPAAPAGESATRALPLRTCQLLGCRLSRTPDVICLPLEDKLVQTA